MFSNATKANPARINGAAVKQVNVYVHPRYGTAKVINSGAISQAVQTAKDPKSAIAVVRILVGKSSPINGVRIDSEP